MRCGQCGERVPEDDRVSCVTGVVFHSRRGASFIQNGECYGEHVEVHHHAGPDRCAGYSPEPGD